MGKPVKLNDDLCWDGPEPSLNRIDLDAALREDKIEFWYQPKIDITLKRLIGVEVLARYSVPGRMVPAVEFISEASTMSIIDLTERALISALRTSANLSEIGIDVRLAINANIEALRRIPVAELVRRHRPNGGKSLGLVFDIPEAQVLENFDEVAEISARLRNDGFSLAVDDFGASILEGKKVWNSTDATVAKLRGVGFSELKLDWKLVRNCGRDGTRKEICRHVIDLAHSFGSLAVAIGVERFDELKTLRELTCDIGQGFLFGKPMSEEDFLVLLWNRAMRKGWKRRSKPRRIPYVPARRVTSNPRSHWAY